jgi:hypothetical protein
MSESLRYILSIPPQQSLGALEGEHTVSELWLVLGPEPG